MILLNSILSTFPTPTLASSDSSANASLPTSQPNLISPPLANTTDLPSTTPSPTPLPLHTLLVHDTDSFKQAFKTPPQPGTHILLQPGTYQGPFYITNLIGQPDAPILIAATDPANPPIIQGKNEALHLVGPQYVILDSLILQNATDNALNIDDNNQPNSPASHITLRNITIKNTGSAGNNDAIKLSGLSHFLIQNISIQNWGNSGSAIDMVGCHHGLILNSSFQADPQHPPITGIQTKGGSSHITVRSCQFLHAGQRAVNIGGRSGLQFFRPQPPSPYEALHITVEGCVFVGSESPIAFVSSLGGTIRFNTFYLPQKWLVRILREQEAPGFLPTAQGTISDNIIAFHSSALQVPLNVGSNVDHKSFTFIRNFWYCIDQPVFSRINLPLHDRDAVYGANPRFKNPDENDFSLLPKSPASSYGSTALPLSPSSNQPIDATSQPSASPSITP